MVKKNKNQLYEGMYILASTLSEDARQKALDKVTAGITSRGGEIHVVHEQGRKKLAYEVNGRREGYYYVIYFSIENNQLIEVWREYHLNEDLIRFMTLRTDQVEEKLEFKPLVQS
ncbi:30S ribosomal protein S6 [Candidatus Aerophobetes bacterium]|uniref:Small ribosomal subunit protein bS6 n=1 Tax=Aerophobetes bacterium TaxID=2030807 RepID=A0A2A4YIW9_UNCAE|nr:MAG: 30S ribosomal protein S6 [Candidatus Aerophobetes bacterium]